MIICCITADWLTAFGTIGAVIVALFLPIIKIFWYRPKFSFFCGKESNCVEAISTQLDTSEVERMIKIRLRVTNTGRGVARSVSFYIDSYKQKRSDESFVQQDFLPTQLRNHKGDFVKTIVPQLNYFIDVVCVKKSDSMSVDIESGKTKQSYELYIPTESDDYKRLGTGMFVIPIKCYSENMRGVSIAYVKILWDNSKECSTDSHHFSVSLMSEESYKNLKKGE